MDTLCSFCRGIDFQSLFFKDLEERSYEHDGYTRGWERRKAPPCSQDSLFLGSWVEVSERGRNGCGFCALVTRRDVCRIRARKRNEPARDKASYSDAIEQQDELQQLQVYLAARNTEVQNGRSPNEVFLHNSLSPAESDIYRNIGHQSAYLYTFLTPADNDDPISKSDSDPARRCLIHPLDNPRSLLRRISPRIDLALINLWFDGCIKSHEICRAKVGAAADQSYWQRKLSLVSKSSDDATVFNRFFKLINVQKKQIVEFGVLSRIPNYAVLSYVWGNISKDYMLKESATWITNPDGGRSTAMSDKIPATIRDAIYVTDRMGILYLWVDSLCITQDNAEEKSVQIQDMVSVYQKASVCLIAVAGDSANAGLSGVSRDRSGYAQSAVRVKEDLTIGATNNATQYLHLGPGKWISRAWTFQELLLSRRLLFFTEDEVYYRCTCITYRESVLEDAADKTAMWFRENKSEQSLETYAMMKYREGGVIHSEDPRWYENCLRDYSARELSFDSDSLNAFAGVGKLFEQRYNTELVLGLPKSIFLNCLAWESTGNLRRRSVKTSKEENAPLFPSWTWAGWEGQVWLKTPDEHWLDWVPTESKIRVLDPILFPGLPAYDGLTQKFATEMTGSQSQITLSGIMPVITKLSSMTLAENTSNTVQQGEANTLLEQSMSTLSHPSIDTVLGNLPSQPFFIQLCIFRGSFGQVSVLAMSVDVTEYELPANSRLRSLNVSSSFRPIRHAFGVVPIGYRHYESWQFKREEHNTPKETYCVDYRLRKFKIPPKVFLARRRGLVVIPFASWVQARPETACVLLG